MFHAETDVMKGALCPSNKFRFQQMFQGARWVDSIQTGCAESKENQIQAGHLLKNIFTVYIYISLCCDWNWKAFDGFGGQTLLWNETYYVDGRIYAAIAAVESMNSKKNNSHQWTQFSSISKGLFSVPSEHSHTMLCLQCKNCLTYYFELFWWWTAAIPDDSFSGGLPCWGSSLENGACNNGDCQATDCRHAFYLVSTLQHASFWDLFCCLATRSVMPTADPTRVFRLRNIDRLTLPSLTALAS